MTIHVTVTLPAGPLAEKVDRLVDHNMPPGVSRKSVEGRRAASSVLNDLNVNPRLLWEWRNSKRKRIQLDTADRVLSASPFLWFDVWPACDAHETLADGCPVCEAYYQARWLFTGQEKPAVAREAA